MVAEFSRRATLCAGLLSLALGQSFAAYPDKPIRIVVTFAPGGASDIVARVISEPLGKALGTTVIVDNKPGAGGTLGGLEVVRAQADAGGALRAALPAGAFAAWDELFGGTVPARS